MKPIRTLLTVTLLGCCHIELGYSDPPLVNLKMSTPPLQKNKQTKTATKAKQAKSKHAIDHHFQFQIASTFL